METFTTNQVSELAQVSLRQLQWWDERKLISPRHEAHRRVYTERETIEICLIAELRRKGISVQKIRRVIRFVQKTPDPRGIILTDGQTMKVEEEPAMAIEVLKKSKAPMVVISLSDIAEHVRDFAPILRKRRPVPRYAMLR